MQGTTDLTGDATVAVIGAGLGGVALIAHMGVRRYRLRLHDLNGDRLTAIRERGGIQLDGPIAGFAPVEMATTNLSEAVNGADLIVVCTGSQYHADVARGLAPLLKDGQAILLIQGGTGGSILVLKELREAGCTTNVDVAEMDNYPFSLGWPEPTHMKGTVFKQLLQVGAVPADRAEAVVAMLRSVLPQITVVPNTLYTGLQNMNAMLHVANVVSNIGRIDSGLEYRFYAEGYTPTITRLLEAADAERLAVGRAYGVQAISVPDWLERTYGFREATLPETFKRLTCDAARGPYQWTPMPRSLEHNYIAEDVPCGLVAMSELGRAAGVPTPVIDGLISTSSALAGRDFRAEGRTLERLGLAGMSVPQIVEVVEKGFPT